MNTFACKHILVTHLFMSTFRCSGWTIFTSLT